MRSRVTMALVATITICLMSALPSHADLSPYFQDFESLVQSDPSALDDDGWQVFGNVFDPPGTTYLYGYGPFAAPNDGFGFCQIDELQGGVDQGLQQLVVFSDYNNADHAIGNRIESNTYREWTIGAANEGETWVFFFESKLGNLELSSTAAAFIKTLDPNAGFALTNLITADQTTTPTTWTGYELSITIDASLVGQILQIGFLSNATSFEGSGVFYDNIDFYVDVVGTPDLADAGASLEQNYPNPFNPQTQIDFTLDRPGHVKLDVFDLAGRRVTTLHRGTLGEGPHSVTWNGRSQDGVGVASGRYTYVLETSNGRISRSMTLLK